MSEDKCPDPNVQTVVDSHIARAEAGLVKYGNDTTRGDLTEVEWLEHLKEELMDAAIYTQRIIEDRKLEVHEATIQAFLADYDMPEGVTTEGREAVVREFVWFLQSRPRQVTTDG